MSVSGGIEGYCFQTAIESIGNRNQPLSIYSIVQTVIYQFDRMEGKENTYVEGELLLVDLLELLAHLLHLSLHLVEGLERVLEGLLLGGGVVLAFGKPGGRREQCARGRRRE